MSMKRFGTFEGVFTPCLLSILGVIMYLRLGWVVGQVGFIGAVVIITLANSITLATGLSMSSISTNIRIGAGGAYSIIMKSLGLEAGGAIGIPLYLSQAISVAFYITGFAECWLFIFPAHDVLVISLIAWFVLLVISYTSAQLAFRLQYIIMALIVLSIVSILFGRVVPVEHFSAWNPHFSMTSFWGIFAIFFPAVTGILAGATMSGELKDPKQSIPLGTLAAIIVGYFIYILLAFWYARHSSLENLQNSKDIAMQLGRWKWAVVAGIMGATISSAMTVFVGAPRTLQALGKHALVPFSAAVSKVNKRGEPATAILFTALLALVTIALGSLDQIATLLTMVFLITYGMINLTVFIEQWMGIPSFRPSLKIPRWVSFFGAIGCGVVMFLINLKFGLIALVIVVGVYWVLIRQNINFYSPDIRSGMLVSLAERFAKQAGQLPYYPKIWKPNLLICIYSEHQLAQVKEVLQAIAAPTGRIIMMFSVAKKISIEEKQKYEEQLEQGLVDLMGKDLFIEKAIIEQRLDSQSMLLSMQLFKGMYFPPNTYFHVLGEDVALIEDEREMINNAEREGLGVVVMHGKVQESDKELGVNLWIRKQSPNMDLALLIMLQLKRNWECDVTLIQVIQEEEEREESRDYLLKLKELTRLPVDVRTKILIGNFYDVLSSVSKVAVNIFGMQEDPDLKMVRDVSVRIETPVLFLRDSSHESAVA